jgi:hypothetical protein
MAIQGKLARQELIGAGNSHVVTVRCGGAGGYAYETRTRDTGLFQGAGGPFNSADEAVSMARAELARDLGVAAGLESLGPC